MLSGVKFLPRDQIEREKGKKSDDSGRKKRKSTKKDRRKERNPKNSSSDDELEKDRKVSRKKKWYASEESVSSSSGSGDSSDEEHQMDRHRQEKKKKKKNRYSDSSDCEVRDKKTNLNTGHENDVNIVRKEMGLEWMLRPAARPDQNTEEVCNEKQEEPLAEEGQKINPKELNPYFRDNGSGYPEEADQANSQTVRDKISSSSVVGDGGASWRLKALKRAKEQAARDGRSLDEVVGERWGSLGQLAVSVASHGAAPSRAHLHAIRSRKMGHNEENNRDANDNDRDAGKHTSRDYMKDVSVDRPKMRVPNGRDSLSWKKRRGHSLSSEDANLVASAVSSLNKFADDGNFMQEIVARQSEVDNSSSDTYFRNSEKSMKEEAELPKRETGGDKQPLSANQLAAKAMQLRMKGKHEEAEKLMKEVQSSNIDKQTGENLTRLKNQISTSRYVMRDMSRRQKEKEENTDVLLARQIAKSKSYSLSGRADDEYDFDGGTSSKRHKKKSAGDEQKLATNQNFAKCIATQQERCLFCFENPNRPKHLVVAIANFTYLKLPQKQPVVPGHCGILTLQHESSTRTVDDNVWDEIRNFKKCLIMMFGKQEKEVVFLETVMGLAQQRRHCMIECIPLPREIAKQAPLYFKKAIDEAEDEWSQHNAKRLIDTSQKGLRGSIPKNFPYFHVEFGLNRGFVHVIDDESQFKNNLGVNVIRGMMQLPEEDMYRKQRYETVDAQKQAVAEFAKEWEPFDWTKQLG